MSLTDDSDGNYVVTQVSPMGTADIATQAERVLAKIAPGFVGQVQQLNLSSLVDHVLPRHGVHFCPVPDDQLPGMWAFAQPHGDEGDDVEVLIQESEWNALHAGGRKAHHARGTVAHELGHVYLHIPQIRRRHSLGLGMPRQVDARELKPYRNAEWQAWCFAGCVLAPGASILAAQTLSVTQLAVTFGTSDDLMKYHLSRLGLRHAR